MNKVKVRICMGTTCFVMGASHFEGIDEELPEDVRSCVEILGSPCLNLCKEQNVGKAPFVLVDGTPMAALSRSELVGLITRRARGLYEK